MRIFFSVLLTILVVFVFSCGENYNGNNSKVDVVCNLPDVDTTQRLKGKWTNEIDDFFSYLSQTFGYSGNILLAKKGQFFVKTMGKANWQTGIEMNLNTPIQIASVSKPITALAVMLLKQKGKVLFTDTVGKFFPNFPYYNVTIQHLLSHTSGLPEYINITDLFWPDSLGFMSNEKLLEILIKNKPKPYGVAGSTHFYCNTNYAILASIVSKVSGLKFEDFLAKYIFGPLNMKSTSVVCTLAKANEMKSVGHFGNNVPRQQHYLNGIIGDKGVYSTVFDLYRFYKGLMNHNYLDSGLRKEMFTTQVKRARFHSSYARGFRKLDTPIHQPYFMFHTGYWHGHRSYFYFQPEQDLCLVILANKLAGGFFSSLMLKEIWHEDGPRKALEWIQGIGDWSRSKKPEGTE